MDNRLFRDAMAKFATGITVITTEYNKEIHGRTVNAFMSISLDPQLIAISIDQKSGMHDILQTTRKFGVSILTENQKDYSMMFAKQKEMDPTLEYDWLEQNPVLKDSLTTLSCQLQNMVKAGDHTIFIAQVTKANVQDGKPLLYYGSKYKEIKEEN